MASDYNLPWIEKYRPKKLTDIVSHQQTVKLLGEFITHRNLPNIIFYGPPGTGKTSLIMTCCQELYGEYYQPMVIHLNASDERGIDVESLIKYVNEIIYCRITYC